MPIVLASPVVVPVIPQPCPSMGIPGPIQKAWIPPLSEASSHSTAASASSSQGSTRARLPSKASANQKRINRELVVAGKRSGLDVLKMVATHLGQMNGVNVATAFHRMSQAPEHEGEELLASAAFSSMLEVAEFYAEQELAKRDASLPANCCTIIAWSCARLRVFPPSLFGKLAAVATPQLGSCQPYEITNLLWAFAEFHKYEQNAASALDPELRALVDAVAEAFRLRSFGAFKVQVLTSALMSVSAFPWDPSFTKTWILTSTFQELVSRWEELAFEGQAQVVLALKRLSIKCNPLYRSLVSKAGGNMISLEAHGDRKSVV